MDDHLDARRGVPDCSHDDRYVAVVIKMIEKDNIWLGRFDGLHPAQRRAGSSSEQEVALLLDALAEQDLSAALSSQTKTLG